MIEIELRDFRGCERASIRVDPIALVAGRNATGKSSIAQAIGAALTGDPFVVEGVAKNSAGALVKTGAASAAVFLSGPQGHARVEWPTCQVASDGKPPQASAIAAGMESLASIPARERAGVIGELLKAAPTREDLQMALADVGLDQALEPLWKLIEADGWDQAHEARKEVGARFKGQWRQITSANYGSRVAAAWVPQGWRAADEKATEKDLAGDVTRAKADHERAIAAVAVSDAERERLMATVDLIPARQIALRDAEAAVKAAAKALDQATDSRRILPSANDEGGLPCPHCGALVRIQQINLVERTLVAVEVIPKAEAKRRRQAIAESDGDIGRLKGELRAKQNTAEKAKRDLDACDEARAQLADLRPSDDSAGDVEATRKAMTSAEARLEAFRQKREADELRDKIVINEKALGILAPDGLRAKKLARVLDTFNTVHLKPRTDAAAWREVRIEPTMVLTYGGRPYGLLSTSEQYRVRIVLQVAIANLTGADLVVIDAADVLDGPTRSGLFAMLGKFPAVVCMTLSRREQVPDIGKFGLGASYWLEGGILEPLASKVAA